MSSQGSMVIQVGVNGEPDQAVRTSLGVEAGKYQFQQLVIGSMVIWAGVSGDPGYTVGKASYVMGGMNWDQW